MAVGTRTTYSQGFNQVTTNFPDSGGKLRTRALDDRTCIGAWLHRDPVLGEPCATGSLHGTHVRSFGDRLRFLGAASLMFARPATMMWRLSFMPFPYFL